MFNQIYDYLNKEQYDAWIIYDYECTNPALIGIIGKRMLTRKCYLVFEKTGKAYILCHLIDKAHLSDSFIKDNFTLICYKTWQELLDLMERKFSSYQRVLMEVSENGLMPRVSTVDYGTVCLIQKYVKEISSSANLVQYFSATVEGISLELQKKSCENVAKIKDEAFDYIREAIKTQNEITEYMVQQFIMKRFEAYGMVTDSEPIVAVNKNASNPHYAPTKEASSVIKRGDFVLIDLWAKMNDERSAFGDITWMGYVGKEIPLFHQKLFDIVKESIEVTLEFLNRELPKRVVYGYEVDDVCRNYIKEKGFGDYFIHRTGHSISVDETPHGKGVNIDNFETHDTRALINHIGFSIEPGIYHEEIGVREEIDVYIEDNKAIVLTPIQKEIIILG